MKLLPKIFLTLVFLVSCGQPKEDYQALKRKVDKLEKLIDQVDEYHSNTRIDFLSSKDYTETFYKLTEASMYSLETRLVKLENAHSKLSNQKCNTQYQQDLDRLISELRAFEEKHGKLGE